MTRSLWLVLCVVAWAIASPLAFAQVEENKQPAAEAPTESPSDRGPAPADGIPAPAAPPAATKTILVPHISYKTVTVPVVVFKPQVQQKTITVQRAVPEQRQVTRMVPVMEPQVRTFTETIPICRMTYEDVPARIQVMVPHLETREGTRTVCKPVLVQESRTVCRDAGDWQDKTVIDAHGCRQVCRVWVPNIVQEQVPVTVCKMQLTEVPFRFQALVCRPEVKNVVRRVCKPLYETQTREVTCTICVPRLVEKQFIEVVCRYEPAEQVVNCVVPVAVTEQRQIQVPVCTLVQKEVTCPAPSCGPTCCW
ncbi:MAG TPA: hypothetical protein VFV87_19885 [Pirellulaceae bacterium]|nr:hypothetical protein [Pirellulaceae bacterium]